MINKQTIGVVIPCYRVKDHILGVLTSIPDFVDHIICVDDRCPVDSGTFIRESVNDSRVQVIRHEVNQGVGGAMLTGYQRATECGCDVLVKIDGDGQMDCSIMEHFIHPIVEGVADYTKGNRFWQLSHARQMPIVRFFGNVILSLMTKASSGYWRIFDPTNGYTAIHSRTFSQLPVETIAKRYFFESDMLHHLGLIRAVVLDIPMQAKYGDEVSGLKIRKIVFDFMFRHSKNILRRVWYQYFLRDFNYGTICLILGLVSMILGTAFASLKWVNALQTGTFASPGTVAIVVLLLVSGLYFILSFLREDMEENHHPPLFRYLPKNQKSRS
jgi:dolichol-phosphate mannosyltransferase